MSEKNANNVAGNRMKRNDRIVRRKRVRLIIPSLRCATFGASISTFAMIGDKERRRLRVEGACWRQERANKIARLAALIYSNQWKIAWIDTN